jgi:hypothetical protein
VLQEARQSYRGHQNVHLVWLKNCAASRSLSIIIGQQSAQALSIDHHATLATHSWLCRNELVVETLMIPLLMIMCQKFSHDRSDHMDLLTSEPYSFHDAISSA